MEVGFGCVRVAVGGLRAGRSGLCSVLCVSDSPVRQDTPPYHVETEKTGVFGWGFVWRAAADPDSFGGERRYYRSITARAFR